MGVNIGGRAARGFRQSLKDSGAETSSTTHDTVDTDLYGTASVVVDVTAASGTTPTLVVVVEGSHDGGDTWTELGRIGANGYRVGSVGTAPSNFSGAATVRGTFPGARLLRTRSIVGGTTPSFTYSVVADVC